MLPGVRVIDLPKNIDERGFFGEIFRKDWTEKILENDEIVQANLSVSYPGVIRAWHRHDRGQVDYFVVLNGAIKICAYDQATKALDQITTSSERLQMIRIPGLYWHGFKNIGDRTCTVVYFVNRMYDYERPDEERRPWNDPEIVDKKTGAPFDWNRLPFG